MGILTVNVENNALRFVSQIQDSGLTAPDRYWTGDQAKYILESGLLPKGCCKSGRYYCDKTLMWHLILAATGAQMQAKVEKWFPRHAQA